MQKSLSPFNAKLKAVLHNTRLTHVQEILPCN